MDNEEKKDRSEIARQGGEARDKKLSSKRKSAIGSLGAMARWSNAFPRAEAEGEIEFAGRVVQCAVLDTKLRVLTQETFLTALGRAGRAKGGQGSRQLMRIGGLPPFIAAENLQPFVSDELRRAATPVVFRTLQGNKAYGYDARLMPMVCEVYLKARYATVATTAHAVTLRTCSSGRMRKTWATVRRRAGAGTALWDHSLDEQLE